MKYVNSVQLTKDLNNLVIAAKSVDYSGHPYSATDDLLKIFNTAISGNAWSKLSVDEKNDLHNGFEAIRYILNEHAEFVKRYPQDFDITGVSLKSKRL